MLSINMIEQCRVLIQYHAYIRNFQLNFTKFKLYLSSKVLPRLRYSLL